MGLQRRLRSLASVEDDPAALARSLRSLRRTDRRRPPWWVRTRWKVEHVDVSGFDLFVMSAKGTPRRDRTLLYLHGGGYLFGPFGTDWSAMRAIAAGASCDFAMLMHPRAPEHDVATTVPVTVAAHTELEERYGAGRVVPVGTSAGGGLAIALLASLRDADRPLPPCAILLSPGVDMTLERDVARYENTDILLSVEHVQSAGRLYAGSVGPRHPTVSPYFGALDALPRLHVFVGSDELLLPSIDAFAEKARAAGGDVRIVLGEGEQHTWPLAPTPEGRMARDRMVQILAECR
jgi:acetyl esterase/lipase